ncbi:sensor histidine kinase [Caulobacter sp. LjRoot300]|uniref:sensor histidine kinase n=1 Tax=Caulobacter sp. LjRoot300 TaxID=3342321 RepID=UPI003ED17461
MAEQETLEKLKAQLTEALEGDDVDFQAILRLAGQISQEEPGVVRFTTDAAMVRRLGRELVAKQETALGELVKNAYDADATFCTVDLIQTGEDSYAFQIVDDGAGMSRADLANGFMRLASDTKVRNPLSPRFGRSRAGKKGIGRFATERLGRRLTIVTQTEDEDHGWTVTIDWNAFAQGEDIGLIGNRIETSPKEREHGTRLSIDGLKDGWSDADLKRVYRYLSSLLQPVFDDAEIQSGEADPGFEVRLNRAGEHLKAENIANADTEILDQALAIIEARIDHEGVATWSMTCAKLDISVVDQPIGLDRNVVRPLPNARDVRLKAWYYIQQRDFLGHSTAFIKKVLNEHGGIRLYRNGYRVPPYGERHDDWLGLDVKNTQIYAPWNSKTFMGFVAVRDPAGERFEETSSREGLIETAAFEEVRQITYSVLLSAVRRIEAKRGLGRNKPEVREEKSGEQAAKDVEAAIESTESLLSDLEDDIAGLPPERQEQLIAVTERLSAAARITAERARERDALVEELNMMRILASMGLTIAEFTHDFSALAETMELNLNALSRAEPGSDAFSKGLDRFRNQFRQVRAYTAHFGSMTTSNASRELQSIDLYAFSRSFAEDLAVMFTRRGLALEVIAPEQYNVRTVQMHPSEWSSILLNLLTNAVKAADRVSRQGRFQISMGRIESGKVYLDFSDNGDGIPAENRSQIFEAFFTTSGAAPVRASEAAQALGTGLGLKIVADIARAAGGSVMVIDPAPGYQTTIRVIVDAEKTPEPSA